MRIGMTVTQFWLPPNLDPGNFARSFETFFQEGKARHIPLVQDAHSPEVDNGSHYFELNVPRERMSDLDLFLNNYAAKYDMVPTMSQASGFGFDHSG